MTKYIDADALLALYDPPPEGVNEWDNYTTTISVIRQNIIDAPAADVAEVVRCKDCYYWTRDEDKTDGFCLCDRRTNLIEAINLMAPYTKENDYCSWGQREEDQDDQRR